MVDLTHTLTTDFPTFSGEQQLEMEQLVNLKDNGYNIYRWLLNEHTGTHMDAPFHFSDGLTADQIPVDQLWGPLAVIDIRQKTEARSGCPGDARRHCRLGGRPRPPARRRDRGPAEWLGSASGHRQVSQCRRPTGVMHFPGFHIEAIEMMLGERNVKGIFVDTLSLDHGPSPDFAVHYRWLPAGKWGVENVANLGLLPAAGATCHRGWAQDRGRLGRAVAAVCIGIGTQRMSPRCHKDTKAPDVYWLMGQVFILTARMISFGMASSSAAPMAR